MNEPRLRLLSLGVAVEPSAGAVSEGVADWAEALSRLDSAAPFDALLVDGDAHPATRPELAAAAALVPVLVVVAEPEAAAASDWLRQGADEVVGRDEVASGAIRRSRRPGDRASAPACGGAAARTRPTPTPACRIAGSSSST